MSNACLRVAETFPQALYVREHIVGVMAVAWGFSVWANIATYANILYLGKR